MLEFAPIINAYIRQFDESFEKESYKWKAVKHFQDTYFNSELPIAETLRTSMKYADNLLVSQDYFPAKMLETFASEKPSSIKPILTLLFDDKIVHTMISTEFAISIVLSSKLTS